MTLLTSLKQIVGKRIASTHETDGFVRLVFDDATHIIFRSTMCCESTAINVLPILPAPLESLELAIITEAEYQADRWKCW